MTQHELLNHLETELRALLTEVREKFVRLPDDVLRQRTSPEAWTILENMAHLNGYADDYIPRLYRAIHLAKARRWASADEVRYTGRGQRLLRRATADKTYRTAKHYNFLNQPLPQDVLKTFIINCEQLLRVIQEIRKVDINRPAVPKAHAWFGRYTPGNLLEFLVLHQKRHIAQAAKIITQ